MWRASPPLLWRECKVIRSRRKSYQISFTLLYFSDKGMWGECNPPHVVLTGRRRLLPGDLEEVLARGVQRLGRGGEVADLLDLVVDAREVEVDEGRDLGLLLHDGRVGVEE